MLKFLMMILFLIPLVFSKKSWHMVHRGLYLATFSFIVFCTTPYIFNYVTYFLGCDIVSYGLILLSFWVCSLILRASQGVLISSYNTKFFKFLILFLLLILYLTFSSMSLFYFYVYFEASLIPTLFLILGWGYQPERIQAGIYLLFYTLLASLPLLVGIFIIYRNLGTLFTPFLQA
jgi:NADH-ubiquinone oxidoreductase chain 4